MTQIHTLHGPMSAETDVALVWLCQTTPRHPHDSESPHKTRQEIS